jgi:UDP-glucose 4-epimerase
MRALVTGATGFLGCALVRALLEKKWQIVCLARDARRASAAGVEARFGDLLRPDSLAFDRDGGQRIDVVFHLGALMPGAKVASDADFVEANASATIRLIEAAQRAGANRFVYLSSISAIGSPRETPIREDHPLAPPSAYSLGKLGGEMACAIASRSGWRAVALRLASPYGLGMTPATVLPVFAAAALAGKPLRWHGSGSRSQDFIHVDDVVAACLAAARVDAPLPLYNLASGKDTPMRALAETIAALAPGACAEPSGADDPQEGVRWSVDVSAARRDLGFCARVPLEDGLARYMRDAGAGARRWTWW